MINDIEKRINLLFDLLNCGTLSEPTQNRILDIAKGSSSSVAAPLPPADPIRNSDRRKKSSRSPRDALGNDHAGVFERGG